MILIVSGPTAVGKNTLIEELLKKDLSIHVPKSSTTRLPRPGEAYGVHYHFITREKFLELRDRGYFIEWAQNHGNFYGTPKDELSLGEKAGYDILLEIDYKGAHQIKEKFPSAASIFILPPTFSSLEKRIRDRGAETEEQIQVRLDTAREELSRVNEFDYWVTNDKIEDALADLVELIDVLRKGNKPDIKRFRNQSLVPTEVSGMVI